MTTIHAAQALVDGHLVGPARLELDGRRIVSVLTGPAAEQGPAADIELGAGTLTPGLLDLQNNGSFGADFADATPQQWADVLTGLASRGVTGLEPTIITAPLAELNEAFDRIHAAQQQPRRRAGDPHPRGAPRGALHLGAAQGRPPGRVHARPHARGPGHPAGQPGHGRGAAHRHPRAGASARPGGDPPARRPGRDRLGRALRRHGGAGVGGRGRRGHHDHAHLQRPTPPEAPRARRRRSRARR